MIKEYLHDLYKQHSWQDNREESFYPLLKSLIEQCAYEYGIKHVHITVLPKKTQSSCPDMRVWDGKQKIIGYIECKTPDTKLDEVEKSEQLIRYRKTFPNVILTNFIEFRLYKNEDFTKKAAITNQAVMLRLKACPPVQQEDKLTELLSIFFSWSYPAIRTASALAQELAKRTRFLKDMLLELTPEDANLQGFHTAFKKYLLPELDLNEFTDLYAQTITYGLFTARTRRGDDFNRLTANKAIPQTIGILKDVFNYLSLQELPPALESMIDDIAGVIAIADIKAIMTEYDSSGKGNDAIVHFYETFLSAYDPELRNKRGVYYTPEPVVSYIVRSIHQLLIDKFKLKDGLADETVTLLDPAAGTLSFIDKAVKTALAQISKTYGSGLVSSMFHQRILPHYIAFELMMAPYTVGHLRMSWLLHELKCELDSNERVRLYLTNTLDPDDIPSINVPGLSSLSTESHLAGEVKRNEPVLVIIGNPPYSGHSANNKKSIKATVKIYKYINNILLQEKQWKWLQDDYVKFIRFAQTKIDKNGEGMLGFITNHAYLDNPTFRGMRWSLMQSFDEIYILNLHGNSQQKEKCPDGTPDKNVFDIKQGVAIAIFIKHPNRTKEAKLYYADLYGTRQIKYEWLSNYELSNSKWTEICPLEPYYLFVPSNDDLSSEYHRGLSVQEIFTVSNVGLVTGNDHLAIHTSINKVLSTISMFYNMDNIQACKTWFRGIHTKIKDIEKRKTDLKETGLDSSKIKPILYRPFDIKYTYYTGRSNGFLTRPIDGISKYLIGGNNVALITVRQVAEEEFNHVLVTNQITESRITISNKGIGYIYPLFQPVLGKEDKDEQNIFGTIGMYDSKSTPNNINPKLFALLNDKYNVEVTPEEIFAYIYAVLNTPIYRTRYIPFLKMDFPKVQFTDDYTAFLKGAELGQKLIELHLMKAPLLDKPLFRFEGNGDYLVTKVEYADSKIWINDNQHFESIAPDIWNFKIGGYQVCDKWLKDRRKQYLSPDEILHYLKILAIAHYTIQYHKQLDEWYLQAFSIIK